MDPYAKVEHLLAEDTTNLEWKLKKSFWLNLQVKVSEIEVIYLNSVLCCRTGALGGLNLVCDDNETICDGGLECSLKDCHKWKLSAQDNGHYKPYSIPQSIIWDDSCKISNKRQSKQQETKKNFSKMGARGRGETTLYLMKLAPMDVAEQFFTIFHSFSKCKKFVYLTMLTSEQLKWYVILIWDHNALPWSLNKFLNLISFPVQPITDMKGLQR